LVMIVIFFSVLLSSRMSTAVLCSMVPVRCFPRASPWCCCFSPCPYPKPVLNPGIKMILLKCGSPHFSTQSPSVTSHPCHTRFPVSILLLGPSYLDLISCTSPPATLASLVPQPPGLFLGCPHSPISHCLQPWLRFPPVKWQSPPLASASFSALWFLIKVSTNISRYCLLICVWVCLLKARMLWFLLTPKGPLLYGVCRCFLWNGSDLRISRERGWEGPSLLALTWRIWIMGREALSFDSRR
jgi:hypothetical protein